MFSSRYRSLSRVELPARCMSYAASSIYGVPSRFCRIWAISFDDIDGASPFIAYLQVKWLRQTCLNQPVTDLRVGSTQSLFGNYVSSSLLTGTPTYNLFRGFWLN